MAVPGGGLRTSAAVPGMGYCWACTAVIANAQTSAASVGIFRVVCFMVAVTHSRVPNLRASSTRSIAPSRGHRGAGSRSQPSSTSARRQSQQLAPEGSRQDYLRPHNGRPFSSLGSRDKPEQGEDGSKQSAWALVIAALLPRWALALRPSCLCPRTNQRRTDRARTERARPCWVGVRIPS